ncbi:DNA ligase 6-like isoform X2 [Cucurbita pepo subsp. pepo]|uniref:DNA ligase 6-like isoform X2 n=1 Tax=Cucurbita pepo subsp. pepo TaxID=3664 RepID=UPI000C9D7003|nr:DNA ligase 6-like isoform X2 [Cucurbita pepo subsp. pepo]
MASESSTAKPLAIDSSLSFVTAIESFSRQLNLSLPPLKLPFRPPPLPADFPQSKLIPKSRFVVDAFSHAGEFSVSYFLSHFHSDHYAGLSPTWCKGIIFCSDVTARLLLEVLKVPLPFVQSLPLREPVVIDGCEDESIEYIVNMIQKIGGESKGSMGSVLFLIATYVIGKEKILLQIASRCNRKIMVDARKMKVLRILGYGGESGVFTEHENESDVHVVGWNVLGEFWPYFRPNFDRMNDIMVEKGYSKVVGFVPTGWTYEMKHKNFSVRSKDSLEIHLVPYSEHSNYNEIREFVKFLKPRRVVPTVGLDVDKLDSKHADKIRKHFGGLVDEMANRKEFLKGFHRGEMSDGIDETATMTVNEDLEEMETVSETCGSSMALSSLQEVGSTDRSVLNDEEQKKIIQELRECLPAWVTQDQILELISRSGRNVVDAVSNFYEQETEFYEHIATLPDNLPKFQGKVVDSPLPFTFPARDDIKKNVFLGNFDVSSGQDSKSSSPRGKMTSKSKASPGKRKRNLQGKPKSKSKKNSSLQSDGSKQSTITKFFGKA